MLLSYLWDSNSFKRSGTNSEACCRAVVLKQVVSHVEREGRDTGKKGTKFLYNYFCTNIFAQIFLLITHD